MLGKVIIGLYLTAFCLVLIPFVLLTVLLYACHVERKRLGLFWYNIDRTLASGAWQTSQETISSEVGRITLGAGQPDGWTPKWDFELRWAKGLARWLNTNPQWWGVNHTKNAIYHADLLDAVDNGKEQ